MAETSRSVNAQLRNSLSGYYPNEEKSIKTLLQQVGVPLSMFKREVIWMLFSQART